jgi:hypothetical protein
MDPSEAWPGIDLSRIGQFGKEKFQISIDMSLRERAKRFLKKNPEKFNYEQLL